MNPGSILLLCLMAAAPLLPADRIVLADGGRSEYSICVSRDASPSESRGATELQRFLEEMSGARLPIVTDDAAGRGPLVLVGRSRITDRLRPKVPFEELGPEGFAIRTSGRNLVIAGGRQRGAMYGVYTFLDKLGCRWFARDVSRIPKLSTVTVGPLEETQKPAFEYREPFFTEAFDKDWAARNRTNGAHSQLDESTGGKIEYYPFVHSFYQLIPPEKYFQDHPEYFSLIEGKRRAERGQLCLTNPAVLRLGVEAVLDWIRQHPEATIYSVSQNDWTGWCECGRCRRVEEEEGGVHSGPILRYVNALAAEIEKRHPDKLIDTLAYWYSEAPPLKARPRPNVRIRLCPIGACEAHPYQKCDRNTYFVKNLEAWSKITNQLYIWHYNTNFSHYLLPFPDFDELAGDIPMYRRYGVVGLFQQGAYAKGGGGENAELRSYVLARLLWNPDIDVEREIDDFMAAYYGKAAGPMREYFDRLHRQVRPSPGGLGHHLWIFIHPNAPYLGGDFIPQARRLFRKAEAAAGDEQVRRRVEKARLSLDYVELTRAKALEARNSVYGPSDLEGLAARFQSFLAAARSHGIQSLHEGRVLEDDERDFAARIRPYRIFSLENERLRLDVVPELSGRIVRMIDKRTGTDLLRRPDPGERGYPDTGGLSVSLHPDFQARAKELTWEAKRTSTDELTLTGTQPGGLRLRWTLRVAGAAVETEASVDNGGSGGVPVALQSRAEYSPGITGDPRIAIGYRKKSGGQVDRTLFEEGLETSGAENYSGGEMPDGEWRAFHREAAPQLLNRFAGEQAGRASLSWTVRAENRVTLAVWSPERNLAPGERLKLETSYEVR